MAPALRKDAAKVQRRGPRNPVHRDKIARPPSKTSPSSATFGFFTLARIGDRMRKEGRNFGILPILVTRSFAGRTRTRPSSLKRSSEVSVSGGVSARPISLIALLPNEQRENSVYGMGVTHLNFLPSSFLFHPSLSPSVTRVRVDLRIFC